VISVRGRITTATSDKPDAAAVLARLASSEGGTTFNDSSPRIRVQSNSTGPGQDNCLEVTSLLINGKPLTGNGYVGPQKDELCRALIPDNAKAIRIIVEQEGFKPFFVNAPLPKPDKHHLIEVDIGDIELAQSDAPRIIQVIEATSSTKGLRFSLTVYNPTQHPQALQNMLFQANRHNKNGLRTCGIMGSFTEFSFNDTLQVIGAAAGKLTFEGQFVEESSGKDYSMGVLGSFERDNCSETERLQISFPVAISLPRADYASIIIALPSSFKLRAARGVKYPALDNNQSPDVKELSPVDFESYRFALLDATGLSYSIIYLRKPKRQVQ
jgi:hypothetical protein